MFLFILRAWGPLKDLEQRLTCVVHVESDMTNLIFTGDLEDSGLENGSGGGVCARVSVGNQSRGSFCISPSRK